MALSAEYMDFLQEQFSVLSHISIRRMFGGAGVFRHGLMFALAPSGGGLALKADEQTIPDFQAEGCEEWTPQKSDGKKMSMGYWYAPESLFDDEDEFRIWAEKAFEAAVRFDRKKPPSQRKLKG